MSFSPRLLLTATLSERDREIDFDLDSTHQAGQVRNKEKNTGEHREPQTDVEIDDANSSS